MKTAWWGDGKERARSHADDLFLDGYENSVIPIGIPFTCWRIFINGHTALTPGR